MKNITKSLLAVFALFAVSCNTDDVEDRPVITPVAGPVLLAPDEGSSYVLLSENATAQAERFVWTPADFDQDVAILYTVEIDMAGNEFANPQSMGSVTGQTQLSVSVESMSAAANAAGGTPFEQGAYEVRVKASVNDTFEAIYSNAVTIQITPYVAVDPELYLVGQVQAYYGLNAWDNTTAIPMRYIGDGTTQVFEAYVKVGVGDGFKFIGEQGSWDSGNYGVIGNQQNGQLENSGGSGDLKVADVTGEGLYYIRVDLDEMEYKSIKMDWGIIGDATPGGWNDETPMTYDFATNTYNISLALQPGELKFRSANTGNYIAGNAWEFNVGQSDPMVTYNPGSGNFPIAGGPYTLSLKINFDGTAEVTGV